MNREDVLMSRRRAARGKGKRGRGGGKRAAGPQGKGARGANEKAREDPMKHEITRNEVRHGSSNLEARKGPGHDVCEPCRKFDFESNYRRRGGAKIGGRLKAYPAGVESGAPKSLPSGKGTHGCWGWGKKVHQGSRNGS